MEVSDAKRLRSLEDENRKLKKVLGRGDAGPGDAERSPDKKCMACPGGARSFVLPRSSLRKCIRPLASGLLLQPGHDEMRAHRSQKWYEQKEARFFDRAYDAPINCSDISP